MTMIKFWLSKALVEAGLTAAVLVIFIVVAIIYKLGDR